MKSWPVFLPALVLASSVTVYLRLASQKEHEAAVEPGKPVSQVEALRSATPGVAVEPAALAVVSPARAAERSEPHPVTAGHAALAEQNALFLALEEALEARDAGLARRLLREHAERFPEVEGGAEDREGFEAIADCIERPGDDSRASAERFIAEHRASPLRRKVRRACLGPRAPILLR